MVSGPASKQALVSSLRMSMIWLRRDWHSLGMGVWCAGLRGNRLRSASVELGKDLVDALARDSETFSDFSDRLTLIEDSFDNGEIAVGAVHLSPMSRLMCHHHNHPPPAVDTSRLTGNEISSPI